MKDASSYAPFPFSFLQTFLARVALGVYSLPKCFDFSMFAVFPSFSNSFLSFMLACCSRRILIRSFASSAGSNRLNDLRNKLQSGPDLADFIDNDKVNPAGLSSPDPSKKQVRARLPPWLKAELPSGENYKHLLKTVYVRELKLATVCEEAKCPNIGECWGGKDGIATATIMLMGDTCTRACKFCNTKTHAHPAPLDPNEPENVAKAVTDWGLNYVVLTSVDRDDLPDFGASHIAKTIRELRRLAKKKLVIECLTPDFNGRRDCIEAVAVSGVRVYAHNIETVERLSPFVRDRRADYRQSLRVLETAKQCAPPLITKTSIMLGLGETRSEIEQCLRDVRSAGIDVITLGQYLRPSKNHLPVKRFVTPEEFEEWSRVGKEMGFRYVASGPMIRSSYRAGEFFIRSLVEENEKKNRDGADAGQTKENTHTCGSSSGAGSKVSLDVAFNSNLDAAFDAACDAGFKS